MVNRINNLEKLGEIIRARNPTEVLYDLGKGSERTEALLTYIDGDNKVVNRITSSPLIRLCGHYGGVSMDIYDSDKNADGYSYTGLKPEGADFESPNHQPDELGNLVISLEENKKLVISQYARIE